LRRHAGRFTMDVAMILERIGKLALRIETQAEVTLEDTNDGYAIRSVHLKARANVPELDEAAFADAATQARIHCPDSRLIRAEITLDARLSESHQ
jgi:osmotically inducible protein OsmC